MSELRKKLFYEQKNGYDLIDQAEHVLVEEYSQGYMKFLNESRTEREAVRNAIALAKEENRDIIKEALQIAVPTYHPKA